MKKIICLFLMLFAFGCSQIEEKLENREITFNINSNQIAVAVVKNTYHTVVRTDTLHKNESPYVWSRKDQNELTVAKGLYIIKIYLNSSDGSEIASGTDIVDN